jgi:hypothetical protein
MNQNNHRMDANAADYLDFMNGVGSSNLEQLAHLQE